MSIQNHSGKGWILILGLDTPGDDDADDDGMYKVHKKGLGFGHPSIYLYQPAYTYIKANKGHVNWLYNLCIILCK